MSQSDQTPAGPASAPGVIAGRSLRCVITFVALAVAVLAFDLIVKHFAFAHVAGEPIYLTRENSLYSSTVPPHDPVVVVPYLLNLKLTTNPGAVFGIGRGRQWFFVTVGLIVVPVIGTLFARTPRAAIWTQIAYALILAGALGNLYDRVSFNAVRDMFHLFPGVHLPFGLEWSRGVRDIYPWIFNIADASLMIGVGLLLIQSFRADTQPRTAPKDPS